MSLTRAEAAAALLARRLAQESLVEFSQQVDIPGRPITEQADEERFAKVETPIAAHHRLLMNTLQRISETPDGRAIIMMPPGSAKALALDTPIPTPDGWKAMGDLRIGDQVFDERGYSCNVTWVSPVWRDRQVYAVTTDCGDQIIADEEHEWLVRLCGKRPSFKIKETRALCKRRSKRPMIDRSKALQLSEAELPIDPYVLGVWLGDGSKADMRMASSVEDQVWLRAELGRLGVQTSNLSHKASFGMLGIRAPFAKAGLLRNKHIPARYLRASVAQRMALVQGLIDTDGTVCKRRGCSTFCNTNKRLAEQFRELVSSLGVKAGWSESRAMLNGKDCGPVYKISFYLAGSARMPRKAALTRNQYRTPNTYIDVTPAGRADTVCIEVDSPSHLFLCGRSMTPTHNSTYASVLFPAWYLGKFPGRQIILASYATALARKMGRRTRQLVASPQYRGIFGTTLSKTSSAANEWALTNDSEYMAGGLLSGLTGNRANGLLIDDPVAGRQEAESEVIRASTKEAYEDDARTRLKPGGWRVIVTTRWHESDLAGGILPENWAGESGPIMCRDGHIWEIICLPAECDRSDDPLGRQIGEGLWPEWFKPGHWDEFKTSPRSWLSLYQQKPTAEQGSYFKREWVRYYDSLPESMSQYMTGDFAVSEDKGDYTELGNFGVDHQGNIYVHDWWYGQTTPDAWINALLNKVVTHKPLWFVGEGGVIRRSIEPFLMKEMENRRTYVATEWLPSTQDKASQARSFQALMSAGKVYFPKPGKDREWVERLIDQMMRFPNGAHDDGVDTCSLFGRFIDKVWNAVKKPEKKVIRFDAPQIIKDWEPNSGERRYG